MIFLYVGVCHGQHGMPTGFGIPLEHIGDSSPHTLAVCSGSTSSASLSCDMPLSRKLAIPDPLRSRRNRGRS